MRRIVKLTRRALVSGVTLSTVGLLAHALFSNRAHAADPVVMTCASYNLTNPVYVSGSTAVATVLAAVGPKLAAATPATTIVVLSLGSCDGVNSIAGNLSLTGTATFWSATGVATTCQLNGEKSDVGLADVFPTSCPDVTTATLTGVKDFAGPVQAMNFAVPKAATENAISAEAAYLTFGLGATGGTTWNDPTRYLVRNFQSGTETMLAKAINVPTSKFLGTDEGGSGKVVTDLGAPSGSADTVIGVLASNQTDDHRDTIKRLAFKGYGQSCAFYPDSDYSSKDKLNVRDGHYAVWGPLHMLAKVGDDGTPTSTAAKGLLDVLLGTTTVAGVDVVDLEITANTVPQCAMHVKRQAELGPITPYTPDASCSCYFDSKRGDASKCTACTADNAATTCTGDTPVCNHGFCEAK